MCQYWAINFKQRDSLLAIRDLASWGERQYMQTLYDSLNFLQLKTNQRVCQLKILINTVIIVVTRTTENLLSSTQFSIQNRPCKKKNPYFSLSRVNGCTKAIFVSNNEGYFCKQQKKEKFVTQLIRYNQLYQNGLCQKGIVCTMRQLH